MRKGELKMMTIINSIINFPLLFIDVIEKYTSLFCFNMIIMSLLRWIDKTLEYNRCGDTLGERLGDVI